MSRLSLLDSDTPCTKVFLLGCLLCVFRTTFGDDTDRNSTSADLKHAKRSLDFPTLFYPGPDNKFVTLSPPPVLPELITILVNGEKEVFERPKSKFAKPHRNEKPETALKSLSQPQRTEDDRPRRVENVIVRHPDALLLQSNIFNELPEVDVSTSPLVEPLSTWEDPSDAEQIEEAEGQEHKEEEDIAEVDHVQEPLFQRHPVMEKIEPSLLHVPFRNLQELPSRNFQEHPSRNFQELPSRNVQEHPSRIFQKLPSRNFHEPLSRPLSGDLPETPRTGRRPVQSVPVSILHDNGERTRQFQPPRNAVLVATIGRTPSPSLPRRKHYSVRPLNYEANLSIQRPAPTAFSCTSVKPGYYGDLETGCKNFHICNHGRKHTFTCPEMTLFNQQLSVCDWSQRVTCHRPSNPTN